MIKIGDKVRKVHGATKTGEEWVHHPSSDMIGTVDVIDGNFAWVLFPSPADRCIIHLNDLEKVK